MANKHIYDAILEHNQVEIVPVDISNLDNLLIELLRVSNLTIDKIKNKCNPTFVVKRDDRLSTMKPKYFNQ